MQSVVAAAIGGENIGETVEGLQRFPINVRYPRELRDSLEELRRLPIVTERGAQMVLADVAESRITDGPPMLRSENARLSGWVYVDIRGPRPARRVRDMQRVVADESATCRPATRSRGRASSSTSSARRRALKVVVPFTLADHLRAAVPDLPPRFDEAALIMARCRSR